ncbi:hypothetical protein [Sphingomonas desiccabilis]|uniref:Uncharacterized protein n=1 Tax=Sphingomonas desiccabilis TaxID=429134 RepID=A0A4Q2IXB5_9SPHN|nr:hypothetical protein [Sphingomonas desiccabilis]MBB3910801.1 hypothetical protein [Sphingomonas desiccabilis]RXZ35409.1 hypothetical protein EO081_07265 [Sphingomonas desiccabilis]
MENPRTESARIHDDRAVIDAAEDAPATASSAGGNLQRDVASQNEVAQALDPEALTRPKKDDAIHNDQARRNQRAPDA